LPRRQISGAGSHRTGNGPRRGHVRADCRPRTAKPMPGNGCKLEPCTPTGRKHRCLDGLSLPSPIRCGQRVKSRRFLPPETFSPEDRPPLTPETSTAASGRVWHNHREPEDFVAPVSDAGSDAREVPARDRGARWCCRVLAPRGARPHTIGISGRVWIKPSLPSGNSTIPIGSPADFPRHAAARRAGFRSASPLLCALNTYSVPAASGAAAHPLQSQ
jgi:hypothetical protein